MAELLPVECAADLRQSLIEYLGTTFSLAEGQTQHALETFLGSPDTGLFKGPYVRARLPFKPAAAGWEELLDVPQEFTPYGHQARAFQRLSSKINDRPQPTVVTTGTGSGKTESFLYPILDHALRAKSHGEGGTKAIILYPMNALANDQARRLAALITGTPELSGITAALYTGEAATVSRTRVSTEGLITSREVIRDRAPDILLTNYKMLDQLLLRHADAKIWQQSAHSLTYLVIDEFHTYDGAQGTDVAMLLRRLGQTIKSYWREDDPAYTTEDWQRPLGKITPVATSATLGDEGDPATMLDFARTITGEEIPAEAVITETRLTLAEWVADAAAVLDQRGLNPRGIDAALIKELDETLTQFTGSVAGIQDTTSTTSRINLTTDPDQATRLILATLYEHGPGEQPDFGDASPAELLNLAKAHPFIQQLISRTARAIDLAELTQEIFPNIRLRDGRAGDPAVFIGVILSMLSHLRAVCGRNAASIDVHLWIRELTRIDRSVSTSAPQFHWSDEGRRVADGEVDQVAETMVLPAIYCRHCGRSGWGVVLAPTGWDLDETDEEIRYRALRRDERFRPLIHAPYEGDGAIDGVEAPSLMWFYPGERKLQATLPEPAAIDSGKVIPVLTNRGEDAGQEVKDQTCPSCESKDSIRFLGSAIATMLSVSISGIFGTANLDDSEKKALVFTDSVQDAAHRAGFVQARSHTMTLRSVIRSAVDYEAKDLGELRTEILREAGDDPRKRYRILHPSLAERPEFEPFWKNAGKRDSTTRAAIRRGEERLAFDLAMELGLRSAVGRTLEATGSLVIDVDATDAALLSAAREALSKVDSLQLEELAATDMELLRWVRGVLHRMRTRGAIAHPWFEKFRLESGARWFIWGGRPRDRGMPGFGRGQSAPAYPYVGGSPAGDDFEPLASHRGWYARWAVKTLQTDPHSGATLSRELFKELARRDVVGQLQSNDGMITYHLDAHKVVVRATTLDQMWQGKFALVCNVCGSKVRSHPESVATFDAGPCLVNRCVGSLEPAREGDNFYRNMYASADARRVIAREHTSLLPAEERLKYEESFKRVDPEADAPNVLVATPTLEMGIDIGDLSTVMLSSMPKTVASYLQRVGRAGRLTGNALTVAFMTARGQTLAQFAEPDSTINGAVRPPATYLDAEEILRRQYIASVADQLARDSSITPPRSSADAIGSTVPNSYLASLMERAEQAGSLETFLHSFEDLDGESSLSDEVIARLRAWATPQTVQGEVAPASSELATRCLTASAQWQTSLEQLRYRVSEIEAVLPELWAASAESGNPAATSDDNEAYRTAKLSINLANRQIATLTSEFWISTMEQFGIFPNYTLLDDSVTLSAGISWRDPDTQEYKSEELTVERASAQALSEYAPGNTFYTHGFAFTIDAVDLGQHSEAVHTWICCPDCGYVIEAGIRGQEVAQNFDVSACPRCGTSDIAGNEQLLDVVELKQVSSAMRREEALIDDSRDERSKEFYRIVTMADINPETSESWFSSGTGFGVRYGRDMSIRWINLGKTAAPGTTHVLGGHQVDAPLFRLCSECGHLDSAAGTNKPQDHRPWCSLRKAVQEKSVTVALARKLHTEGLILRIPQGTTKGQENITQSISAAVLLALRERIGGNPDHLEVTIVRDPSPLHEENPEAIMLHDRVPGGTGYLAELADPQQLWAMLRHAWELLRDCSCQSDQRITCEKCLLPFIQTRNAGSVSRSAAEYGLKTILLDTTNPDELEQTADIPEEMGWDITYEEPLPASPESYLEQYFREQLRGWLQTMGASIQEINTQTPATWRITMPGGRTWRLEPQRNILNSKPDFVLTSALPNVPDTAIFLDGYTFHATARHNRVADDAQKRHALQQAGYNVISLTLADLKLDENQPVRAPWFTDDAWEMIMSSAGSALSPKAPALIKESGYKLLQLWIKDPIECQKVLADLSRWLPLLFLPTAQIQGELDPLADLADLTRAVLAQPEGSPFSLPAADREAEVPSHIDVLKTGAIWRGGTLAVGIKLGMQDDGRGGVFPRSHMAVVLADANEDLGEQQKSSWQSWLHLSNLLRLREEQTVITTSSLVTESTLIATVAAELAPTLDTARSVVDLRLPAHWDELVSEATEEEQELLAKIVDIAHAIPVPELGVEIESGLPIPIAWPEEQVALEWDDITEQDRQDLSAEGWRLVQPDPARLEAVLSGNEEKN